MLELNLVGWERVLWDMEGEMVRFTLQGEKIAQKIATGPLASLKS